MIALERTPRFLDRYQSGFGYPTGVTFLGPRPLLRSAAPRGEAAGSIPGPRPALAQHGGVAYSMGGRSDEAPGDLERRPHLGRGRDRPLDRLVTEKTRRFLREMFYFEPIDDPPGELHRHPARRLARLRHAHRPVCHERGPASLGHCRGGGPDQPRQPRGRSAVPPAPYPPNSIDVLRPRAIRCCPPCASSRSAPRSPSTRSPATARTPPGNAPGETWLRPSPCPPRRGGQRALARWSRRGSTTTRRRSPRSSGSSRTCRGWGGTGPSCGCEPEIRGRRSTRIGRSDLSHAGSGASIQTRQRGDQRPRFGAPSGL